uniref:Uncharacterized protein n=2 Tax=Pyrodinium bahamense TaxID=73915 RepID=A0A7R9ZZZ3_9DINO|mmetsp:Transcript_17276/g.47674  ORF Transcript_17276/g.47674 Transcript_17276/m.47674 type:complete len:464 (+) Transcript_17276:95-1486(+)
MRARAKAEAAWGRKTEDALKEVGDSVKEVFRGMEESINSMKLRPGWWGTGHGHEREAATPFSCHGGIKVPPLQTGPSMQHAARRAGHPAAACPAQPSVVNGVAWSNPVVAPALGPPASASAGASTFKEDDGAMRRHCAALERLVVEIGLSPQAARVALRHLDAWLVADAGKAEMAAAEAAAHSSGEVILHVGDSVRLEGLVKNKDANGKRGELAAYRADDHRWKVVLTDGQIYWVRPTLLRPLELKRLPLPNPDAAEGSREAAGESPTCQAIALAAGWAKLEARQAAWKEEQEAREIELLEREMSLHKHQEALEVQQQELGQRALDQARTLVELEQHTASGVKRDQGIEFHHIAGNSPRGSQTDLAEPGLEEAHFMDKGASDEEETSNEDGDEMWETDWCAVSPDRAAAASSRSGGSPRALAAVSPVPELPELQHLGTTGGNAAPRQRGLQGSAPGGVRTSSR